MMNENQPRTSPIAIRVLAPADADQYQFVRLLALHEQPPAFGSVPEDEPDLSEIAARLIQSNDRCFFGAFQADRLIGIVRISRESAASEKHRAYLGGLFVLPGFRRDGYGRSLMQQALSWATNAPNLRRVNLTVVTEQTAAICLYRSLGFHIYGTEPETFFKNGRFYDEHLMTLELASSKSEP